jgi:iron complex transport system ATP-binding protein
LSGGEFQLVQLARAIAQESKVLIIDEGLSNLDLRFQKIIFAMIDRLHFSGKTIFLVCHDLNLISEFCPNILWMASGKNFIAGPTFQVFSQENLEQVYGLNNAFTVGENPHTKRLKYFWK